MAFWLSTRIRAQGLRETSGQLQTVDRPQDLNRGMTGLEKAVWLTGNDQALIALAGRSGTAKHAVPQPATASETRTAASRARHGSALKMLKPRVMSRQEGRQGPRPRGTISWFRSEAPGASPARLKQTPGETSAGVNAEEKDRSDDDDLDTHKHRTRRTPNPAPILSHRTCRGPHDATPGLSKIASGNLIGGRPPEEELPVVEAMNQHPPSRARPA